MNTISFVTANYVAQQLNYHMTEGWNQGDTATVEYYRPIETFHERFDALLGNIRALGFDAIDLWLAHLHPSWATPEHIAAAQTLLNKHDLRITSLAGWFGSTIEELDASCKLAVALNTSILAGTSALLPQHRERVIEILQHYNVKLGIENHPEKNSQEVLDKIGDGASGYIGAAIDTGWFGTQGYDAAQAIIELQDHLLALHLKDVLAPGAHDTCRYGQGVVPIEQCVQALQQIGYTGVITVEHEPELYDPTEDVRESYAMLRGWLQM